MSDRERGLHIRADRHIYRGDAIQLYGYDGLGHVGPLMLTTHPEGDYLDTFASLSMTAAQQLIDDLWRCGLRPSEGSGSAGSLAATERHLLDMRALIFAKLNVELPKRP